MTNKVRSAIEKRGNVLSVDFEVFAVGIGTLAEAAPVHHPKSELGRKRFLRIPCQVGAEDITMHQHHVWSAALLDDLDRRDHHAPLAVVEPLRPCSCAAHMRAYNARSGAHLRTRNGRYSGDLS